MIIWQKSTCKRCRYIFLHLYQYTTNTDTVKSHTNHLIDIYNSCYLPCPSLQSLRYLNQYTKNSKFTQISIHSLNPSNIMIFPTFIFLQYICPIQLLNLTYAPQHICFSFTILNPAKTHSSPIQKHQCSIGSQENIHYKSNYTFQFQILINWVSKQTKNPLY